MIWQAQDLLLNVVLPLLLILAIIAVMIAVTKRLSDPKPPVRLPLETPRKRGKPLRYTDYFYDKDGPENYED